MYGVTDVWQAEMQITDDFMPQQRSMQNKLVITVEKIFIK